MYVAWALTTLLLPSSGHFNTDIVCRTGVLVRRLRIKLRGTAAQEQRARLKLEGVNFNGKCVDMERCEHSIRPWDVYV